MVDGPIIKQVLRDNLLDDLFQDFLPEVLRRNLLSVLRGDDDGIYAQRDGRATVLLVFDRDLGLGIRAKPRQEARAACRGHGRIELVGEHDGEWHILWRLIGGIAKHDPLVSRAVILEGAMVETLGNVGGLLFNGDEDVAGLVVKALLRVVVANVLDGIADDFLVVELGLGRDLAKDHDHARLGSRLAGDLRRRVLFKAGIELDSTLDINYHHHIRSDLLWHPRPGHRSCLVYHLRPTTSQFGAVTRTRVTFTD